MAPTDTPGGSSIQSEESINEWRQDLNAFGTGLPKIHPNPFWRTPEDEFQNEVMQLDGRIPQLTDEQVIVELARIASMIDGHTHLPLFQASVNFHLYPIRLYQFSDGLFIVDTDPEYAEFIGSKVTRVGNMDVGGAYDTVAPLVPHDNDMTTQLLVPVYLTVPEVLLALGIIEDVQNPGYVLEMPGGEFVTLDLPPLSSGQYRNWTSLFIDLAGLPISMERRPTSRGSDNFRYGILEGSGILYIQYNQVQSLTSSGSSPAGRIKEIENIVGQVGIQKVVVDIRHNPGGNINSAGPFFELLRGNEHINQPGKLFIVIGRHTFSAAALFAVDLEGNTDAIFVGEPTGGRPNLYGDTVPIRLPNSGISIMVSNIYWQRSDPDDDRDWIEPDILAPLSSSDYFNGIDPALEAIIQYGN